MAGFESATLANGLTVHASTWHDRPWQAINFVVHSGALRDASQREGSAHFLEHLVSENTPLGAEKITEIFEDVGGHAHLGATSWHDAMYGFFAPSNPSVFERSLDIFGPMLLTRRIERYIERERGVIMGEFHRYFPYDWRYETARRAASSLHHGTLFADLVSVLGSPESIATIAESDLQAYYDAHYTPRNMSVVAVGGLPFEKIVHLLEASPFSLAKVGERTRRFEPQHNVASPLERQIRIELPKGLGSGTADYETSALVPGTIDSHTLVILHEMLYKKLFREIREKRAWAYAVNHSWQRFSGYYGVAIGCVGLAKEAVNEVDDVVSDCIDSLRGDTTAFEDARRRIVLGARLQDVSGNKTCHNATQDLTRYGKIMSTAEHETAATSITIDEVNRVLEHLSAPRRCTVLTVP